MAVHRRRRRRAPQAREPAAHRIVQDPRRVPAHLPAVARPSAPTAWSPRPPATTRRAWPCRPACSASSPPSSCPRAPRSPRSNATEAYGADIVFHGQYLDQALVAARAFAQETGAVLIHPFDHVDIVTGQGTCGPRDHRAGARRQDHRGAHRRGRAARGHRHRRQGARARRARRRRPGGRRGGVPEVAGRRTPGGARAHAHHRRRHRGRLPGRDHLRRRAGVRRRHPHRLRGLTVPRACCRSPSGPSRWSSPPARPRSPRCSTTRPASRRLRWWCSAAATSTPCCSAR